MSGVKIWSPFYSDRGGVNYINNTWVLFNKNKRRVRVKNYNCKATMATQETFVFFSKSNPVRILENNIFSWDHLRYPAG